MADAAGRLVTLVAYDEDGLPRPVLVDADGNLLVSNQGGASGGILKDPEGKLMTPVGIDPDDLPRPILVDADGYIKVSGCGGRVKIYDNIRTASGNWIIADIPQGFDNLEFTIMARVDRDAGDAGVSFYYNEDFVAANYYFSIHIAGSLHDAGVGAGASIGLVPGHLAPVNRVGFIGGIVASYSEAIYSKACRTWGGRESSGGQYLLTEHFTQWNNSVAITRLDVKVNDGLGFTSGSRLILYGTC